MGTTMKRIIIEHIFMLILISIYALLRFKKINFVQSIESFCVGTCIGIVSIELTKKIIKTR